MKEIQKIWIESGYRSFALEGPNGLKIERIAKEVGKNKSSFYHLFADINIFTSILLDYHLEQSKIVTKKESNCVQLQELIDVLIEHKIDLLFNRQLRIHRENNEFRECFLKVNNLTIPAIIPIWSNIIDLNDNSYLTKLVLQLSLENFFLQITHENLDPIWLHKYFNNLKELVNQFKLKGHLRPIDGNV